MNKLSWTLGVALSLIGLFIILIFFIVIKFDFTKVNDSQDLIQKTYEINGNEVTSINVKEVSQDIIVKKSTDNTIRITYYERKNVKLQIDKINNQLKLSRNNNKIFNLNIFGVTLNKEATVIELPENIIYKISIYGTSSDIKISNLNFKEIKLNTVSGDINMNNINATNLTINTTSGDINNNKIITKNLNINTISGNVVMNKNNLQKLKINTTSGDINFINLEAKDIKINTVSGNIKGNILEHQYYYTITKSTVSGDFNFGKLKGAKDNYKLNVHTTSGDADISFK